MGRGLHRQKKPNIEMTPCYECTPVGKMLATPVWAMYHKLRQLRAEELRTGPMASNPIQIR